MVEKAKGIHPRIEYGKEEIEAFKRALPESPALQAEVESIRKRCDELMTKELLTEEYANAVFSQHGNFYEVGAQICDFAEKFSFMYQLGETKYVPKMKEALLHYASFAAWTGPSNIKRKTPWHSDLSTTRIVYGFAVAYDCMYDAFTEKEREIIRGAMLKLGIHPLLSDWMYDGSRVHALDSMGHNWWSVCTGLAGVALCAIYDEVDGSLGILLDVLKSLRMFCEYKGDSLLNKVANFDSEGMFYESLGYFNYGAGEMCRFLFTWRRCFADDGESDIPILEKIPSAYLSMVYPTSGSERNLYVNFGDSNLSGGGFIALPRYLLLLGCGGSDLKRYYCRARQRKDLPDLLYPGILDSWDGVSPAYPKTSLFPGTGIGILRSSDAEDATMLAVRCGFTWNHAHDDAGTFILFDKGEALLCDSGTVGYGRPDYVRHYCAAEAHNVVTINGGAQWKETQYRGNKFPGTVSRHMEDGKLAYLLADATGPTCNTCMRNHRSFLRLDDDLFVIVDELYTYEESEFAWLLHYSGVMTEEGNTMRIVSGKAKAAVTTVSPSEYTLERRSHDDKEYAALRLTGKSRLCNLINVVSLGEASVTALSGADWYGCRIASGGNTYTVCCNFEADGRRMHVNSNNRMAGWDTDAYILCDVNDGERVMMIYGSYLRKDGCSRFECLQKEDRIL